MRRRVLAALAAGAVAVAAGCGDDEGSAAGPRLEWQGTPVVFAPDGRPDDRILSGRVRNTGDDPVEVRADELFTVAGDRKRTAANGRFAEAFGHGLYGPGGPPAPFNASRYDQRRLGEIAILEPGASKPLTVAWRGTAEELQVARWRLELPPVTTDARR